jgi:transmembrane sensor
MRLSSQQIDRQAAEWAFKLESGPLAPEQQAELDAWLEADVRHPGALGKAVACLARIDRIGAIGADGLKRTLKPATFWTRRRMVVGGGATASLLAATVSGVILWNDQEPEEFVTKIGETCTVNLADGSTVTLNTDTKLRVAFRKEARDVQLIRGEAMFHVAKDKRRPFIVTAAETQVRAIGTAFNVQLLPQRPVRILVQEGIVEVSQPNTEGVRRVRAPAGTKAVVAEGSAITTHSVSAVQLERDLAWQHGQLEFNNVTLAMAAEEFARYSGTRITIDPAIANRTITGSYAANDPEGFARTAAAVLDVQFRIEDDEIRISR